MGIFNSSEYNTQKHITNSELNGTMDTNSRSNEIDKWKTKY